mmetsp:Transcript_30692/g.70747  ORF Transcript_30692/g.70747 Transcript_30692/m.70747 type:complete len:246 (+) Transcript_30692:553-1290(+)
MGLHATHPLLHLGRDCILLPPGSIEISRIFLNQMGPLGSPSTSKLATSNLHSLGHTLNVGGLILHRLCVISVVNLLSVCRSVLVVHEESTLMIIFLHEPHFALCLWLVDPQLPVLVPDFIVGHLATALDFGLLTLKLVAFFAITLNAPQLSQFPTLELLSRILLIVCVNLLHRRLRSQLNAELVLLDFLRYQLPGLHFARLLFGFSSLQSCLLLLLQPLCLSNGITVGLGHKYWLKHLPARHIIL